MSYGSEIFIKVNLKHKDKLNQILKENDLSDYFKTTNDKNYYYAYRIWLKFHEEYKDKDMDALIDFIENDKENSKAMLVIEGDNTVIYWGAYRQIDLLAICDINSRSFPILQLR